MSRIRNYLVSLGVVFTLGLSTVQAGAKTVDSVRYTVRTPNSGIEAGAARIRVNASSDTVLGVVTDYARWNQFITRFEKVRVVGRSADTVDVYLQVPILKGAAKIWAVVRFAPPKVVGSERVIEGHMVKGNVDRLDAKWRIVQVDDKTSELHLEMLLVPKLPVPGSLVTGEVAYAADKAVIDVRTAVEQRR